MPTDDSSMDADHHKPIEVTFERLLSLLSISPDALLVIDQAGILLMLNERAEALFGYAHGELVGQSLDVLLLGGISSAYTTDLTQYGSTSTTHFINRELFLLGKREDGISFPADIILTPILLGEAYCAIGAVRDMTVVQQSIAKQLNSYREIEQHLSIVNLILSATAESVYLFDTQGRYRFVSESAARTLGVAQGDFLGKTWQEIGFAEGSLAAFDVQFQKVLSTGKTIVDEVLYPLPSGLRWFEYITLPIFGQDGSIESVVVSAQDITERRQVADRLHLLATIVESSAEAIISITLEGEVTSWNSSAEKLYGYSADEVIGQSILFLFPRHLYHECWDILARIRTGEIVKDLESKRNRKDGSVIEVSITISPIRDHSGCITGAAAIAHDITEHKRLMRELLDVNSALEESNQVRDQFISTMPHINGWQMLHQLKDNPLSAAILVVMISVLAEQTTSYVLGADAYVLKPFKTDEIVSTFQRIMEPQHDAFPPHLSETLSAAQDCDQTREEART